MKAGQVTQPIQLRYCNPLHIGVRCWTGGFGAIKNGGKETLILQKVDVPIFPNRTQCEVEITKALRCEISDFCLHLFPQNKRT